MCKYGTDETITIDSKPVKVDKCIAPLIQMLNDYGIETVACCCGHGGTKGSIVISKEAIKWNYGYPVLVTKKREKEKDDD